jgi:hypothetical protein
MRPALLDHDEVLRSAIEAHGGYLFSHTGDGVVAAFASPKAAVDAAVAAQRALELPVRMGLATGEAELRDADYFGTVSRPTITGCSTISAENAPRQGDNQVKGGVDMTTPVKLGTQAIGAAGELLVQYQLLKQGIDSARLTTDSGIDLVMYVPGHRTAATIQVKTNLASKPAGGKGKDLLSWPFPDDSKAQWLACVDMSTDRVWMFQIDEARELAQQKHADGTRLLYFYTDESVGSKSLRVSDMIGHRLDPVIATLLGGQPRELP